MAEKRVYEGMFLLDAGQDIEAAGEPIRKVLGRGEAEVLTLKPWDERRLTYDIEDRKRGLYVLTYFKLDPTRVAELERDAELNEGVLRMLVLRRDHVTDEQLSAETPAMSVARRAEAEGDEKAGDGREGAPATSENAAAEQVAAAAAPAPVEQPAEADAGNESASKEE